MSSIEQMTAIIPHYRVVKTTLRGNPERFSGEKA